MEIIKCQRENEESSHSGGTFDEDDDHPFVIAELIQKPAQHRNTNAPKALCDVSIDSVQVESNFYSSSSTSSTIIQSSLVNPMHLNHNQNAALVASSPISTDDITAMPPPTPPSSSTSTSSNNTTQSLQRGRADPLSDLTVQLSELKNERDKWKNKYLALEKRYIELQNISISKLC